MICIVLSISSAFAKDNTWTEGFGQGTTEYFINNNEITLLISCTDKDDENAPESSVVVFNNKTNKKGKGIYIDVNNNKYSLPLVAGSRVDVNNFIQLLEDLRKNDFSLNSSSGSLSFKKNASNKIIPKFGSKNFTCKTF